MKLLLCKECGDVFSLTFEERRCMCKKSFGRYIDDINAEIGGPSIPLGFNNRSFIAALQMQAIEDRYNEATNADPSCCKGVDFAAFVIPANATSVKRVSDDVASASTEKEVKLIDFLAGESVDGEFLVWHKSDPNNAVAAIFPGPFRDSLLEAIWPSAK